MPARRLFVPLALVLLPPLLTGCLSAEARRAQYFGRRAQVEVTTARGRPVVLQLVAKDNGAARAGVSYARTQQWRDALAQLHAATDADGRDHRAWYALGAVYEKTGRLHRAFDAYRTAYFLRDEPAYEEAWRRVRAKGGGPAPADHAADRRDRVP